MAQEFRSLRAAAQSIGFHELRQALEISALKQDLERIARETGELRAHIEDAVEQVRAQVAALAPEELADASRMAPLLQSAVRSLLGIRDAVRRIEVQAGPVPDADRADPPPLSLLHPDPAPEPPAAGPPMDRPRPVQTEPPTAPPPLPFAAPPPMTAAPVLPPRPAVAPPPPPPSGLSWLMPTSAPAPAPPPPPSLSASSLPAPPGVATVPMAPRPRPAPAAAPAAAPSAPQGVDWLQPARR